MAVNQQAKRRALAKKVVTQATLLADAERELKKQLEEATRAGLVFIDADFDGQVGLQHLDATSFNAISGVITAVDTTLSANNNAHWATLLKMIA